MHPLTRFFNFLKRKDFSMVVTREHLGHRELTGWYPDWMYEGMETDEVRNQPYRETIRELVAGKVVLELGTGRKALWAVCCARAGAARVYAIEANQKAYEASVRFLKSRNIENVHLIHGFSDKISLPERCDVLVHDLVGDIASSEGMLPFIEDAKQRLLKPDALHIPQRCSTYAFLAEDPELRSSEWALSYVLRGFQPFEPLRFVRFFGFRQEAALSDPQICEDFVFHQILGLRTDTRLRMEIRRDGLLRGVCFFIRLQFSETRAFDTWNNQTSWSTPYLRLNHPTPVCKGDIFEMSIQSDLSDNPSYSMKLVQIVNGSARDIGEYTWAGD